jgi:hypothetical protein
MNAESGRIWKEEAVALPGHNPGISLELLRNTTKLRIAGVRDEIRSEHHPNTSLSLTARAICLVITL